MKRRSKFVQQRPILPLCGDLRNYESIGIAAVGENLACRTEFSTADLGFDNFGASSLAICIVAGYLERRELSRSHDVSIASFPGSPLAFSIFRRRCDVCT